MEKLEYLKFSVLNRKAILNSSECVCIYCFKKMKPEEIIDFCIGIDPDTKEDREETGICPYCDIDTIIPNSLIEYNDEMIKKWHNQGFNDNIVLLQFNGTDFEPYIKP